MDIIRGYYELLELTEDQMTEDEKRRLQNAKDIPDTVRNCLEEKARQLGQQVLDLETVRDEIVDFLNGFWPVHKEG